MASHSNTQLALRLEQPTRGGARAGAGRKKGKGHDAEHRLRPVHKGRHPVHVVLRVRRDVGRLRKGRVLRALRRALLVVAGSHFERFRIVHMSIQHNHLHLLVEAAHKEALSHGMQSFGISAARAINRVQGRAGKVFAFRYHATALTSRRQTRHALAYVLNNWRRHREDLEGVKQRRALVDPYSSGVLFDGWSVGPFRVPDDFVPLGVKPAQTWLLREGWRMYGAIDPREVPGDRVR